MTLSNIARVLETKKSFLLVTHKDPDVDGIGSMLALGKALCNAGKEVVMLTGKPVRFPVSSLKGSEEIVHTVDSEIDFDVLIALDCGHADRISAPEKCFKMTDLILNIDHHQSDKFFGDVNLIDPDSSSTGELVYRIIKEARLPIDADAAENIFAAVRSDTGSFRYANTTCESFRIAAEMMTYGVDPWKIFLKMKDEYSLSQIKLLKMALGSVEFYHEGRVGMVTLSSEMFQRAGARREDSERFVDYLRFVSGVELAVLIRETDNHIYKFSMRSKDSIDAARLASLFGGGGHAQAAGFDCYDSFEVLKREFLKAAGKLLSGTSN